MIIRLAFLALFAGDPSVVAGDGQALASAIPPVALEWHAPDHCPDGVAVQDRIRSLIGADLHSRLSATLHAQGTVYPSTTGRWQLDLRTRIGNLEGERHLSAEDCIQLSQVAALVLALMINPQAGSLPSTLPLSSPPPSPPPPSPPLPPSPPPPSPPPPPGPKVVVGLDVLAVRGALPGFAGGLAARGAYLGSGWGMQASAGWFQSRSQGSATKPQAGGEFHLFRAGAIGCGLSSTKRRVRGEGCLGFVAYRLRGVGVGIAAPRDSAAWWPSLSTELALRTRLLWRIEGRIFVENSLSTSRPRFAIDDVGLVFQPSVWNLSFGMGVSILY